MFGFRRANNSGVAPTIKQIGANTAVTYHVGDALVITSGKAALAGATAKPEYVAAQGGLGLDTLSAYQVNSDQEYETTLAETGAVVVGTKVTLSSSNSITTTTTNGVAEVVSVAGTAAGSAAVVKF